MLKPSQLLQWNPSKPHERGKTDMLQNAVFGSGIGKTFFLCEACAICSAPHPTHPLPKQVPGFKNMYTHMHTTCTDLQGLAARAKERRVAVGRVPVRRAAHSEPAEWALSEGEGESGRPLRTRARVHELCYVGADKNRMGERGELLCDGCPSGAVPPKPILPMG